MNNLNLKLSLGAQIYQSDFDSESIEIEVSQHPAGVYYCVIQTENETVVRKFVKQ
ncbi:MAG TPA: T9SS type A sorting domain-containing protein [Bacteroidales bacterium]|nr:T9SS type A sorting domain-containing protein [Bacteroidales bacterium]